MKRVEMERGDDGESKGPGFLGNGERKGGVR